MKIKRIGRLWPRDKFSFFRENPELWTQLKEGEPVEVPDELFVELKGVEEIKEETKEDTNLAPKRRGRPPLSGIAISEE